MVYVGIDVAKDKHDCFIANSDGEILYDVFTIQNDMDGFEDLLFKIKTASRDLSKVKVGLEATGHYSCNILGFLHNKGLTTIVINSYIEKAEAKYLKSNATCTSKAIYYISCSVCGVNGTQTFEYDKLDPNNHTGNTYLKDQRDASCYENNIPIRMVPCLIIIPLNLVFKGRELRLMFC